MTQVKFLILSLVASTILPLSALGSTRSLDSISPPMETEDWHSILEEMAENEINTEEWEESLTELANNPVQLNTASRETLERIPILNPEQVENLSYYLYRYGPIVNLSELLLVEGMDARTMRWLRPFVRVGAIEETRIDYPPMKKALLYGKHEIRWSMGETIQKKNGYDALADSTDRYMGDPMHASFRYGFDYKDQLQWGVVLEKDPGELWWDGKKGGADYVSMHLLVKDSKRRNTLIIGDYKVRFGQGLVCGSAFSLGKNTSGGVPELSGPMISRHFSASEMNFLRGVAFRLTLKPYVLEKGRRFGIDLSTFLSSKKLDYSIENGLFTSIISTGLHRTFSEKEHQEKMRQSVIGGHLQFRWTNLTIGATALGWLNDASMAQSNDSWAIFNVKGNKGGNVSADFRTVWKGLLAYGEFALDQNGHHALLTGISFKPFPRMNVSIVGRKYTASYQGLFSNSFSEGTSTRNEEGLYSCTDFQLAKRIRFSGYLDVFRFPWLRYSVNSPSWGKDVAAEWTMTVGKNGLVKFMIKSKSKEKNSSLDELPTHPIKSDRKEQMRLQISQKLGLLSMKTLLYGNSYHFINQEGKGYAVAQDIGFEGIGSKFSAVLHTVLFNTETWENKIYLWEKDLPGAFSMPMLYGQGFRTALFVRCNFSKLSIQMKYADSAQPGLDVLGIGSEQISGSRKSEVRIQLSWKF